MDDYYRRALVALQGDLKDNISLDGGLDDKLSRDAGGFLNQRETTMVVNRPDSVQQVGKLLEILRGKSNAEFFTFCKLLRDCNYGKWAQLLEEKAKELGAPAPQPPPASDLPPKPSAGKILLNNRKRFIEDMDSSKIVYDLEAMDIISQGDRALVMKEAGTDEQNATLFPYLQRKCTMATLAQVCDLIVDVRGNPKMVEFGKDLRSQLS